MKFLCGNCKAKYQIADEKVSGRTLRMKCRRCGHDILIDGHGMAASVPPAAASSVPAAAAPGSARKPGASSVIPAPPARSDAQPRASASIPQPPGRALPARSRPPSALSQDFRRHIAAPPEVPQRTAPYDLWHVAIQDVPVGPMTREELARKVESGAVTGESLCWREGMDDWRPMSELAELAQLLRKARAGEGSWSGRPPPRRTSNVGRGAEADVLEDDVEPTRASVAPATPAFGPPPKASRADASLPMPALGAKLPAFQPGSNPFQASASQPLAAAAPPAPQPAFVQPQPIAGEPSGAMPLPAASAGSSSRFSPQSLTMLAVGLLVGILLVGGPALYKNSWGAPTPAPIAQVTPTPAPTPAPVPSTSAPDLVIDVPEDKPAEPEKPAASATKPSTSPGRGTKTDPKADTSTLSEAERKLLERMGGSGASGPNLEGVGGKTKHDDAPSGPALTANQLMGVVQNNKTQLQRCYETALRASGGKQDGAIKITVNVTVGTSGSVKGVVTQGNGMSSMNDCLKTSVKRWRFPQSGGESEFAFPLVFQPGA